MSLKIEVQPLPSTVIALHCLKYPAKSVIGILIGQVKEVIPVAHESTPLAPSLELVTAIIHAKHGSSIVGVYCCNDSCNDQSISPYAIRLAERISSVSSTPPILVQVLNERSLVDFEEELLQAYEKDGDSWKKHRIQTSPNSFRVLQGAVHDKLYRELKDFENHLDAPECDFYNKDLYEKIKVAYK